MKKRFIVFILLAGMMISCSEKKEENKKADDKKMNVLFIAIDDLKPILGAYGDQFVISPNIDKLAEQGTIFTNNHCQYAVCGPSRASLLSGQRPDYTRILNLKTLIRDKRPEVVTLPQYFKSQGYNTYGIGKIFDPRSVDQFQDKISWTDYIYMKDLKFHEGYDPPEFGYYQSPEHLKRIAELKKEARDKGLNNRDIRKYVLKRYKIAWEKAEVPDDAYEDGAIVNGGIELMQKAVKSGKPFFLAVGFKRPHLPFNAPSKYWDLYDENKVPLSLNQEKSKDGFDLAYQPSWELSSYKVPGYTYKEIDGVIRIPEKQQRQLIHGYYAATSYVDTQVGKLMEELKEEGLDKNTIVILWGDHGWHLGDHSMWNKHTDFEQATRSPMIIFDPRAGKRIDISTPTEFVDIYPTLCELAGIELPDDLAGISLKSMVEGKKDRLKTYAYSEITRNDEQVIGYSLRNDRYRYTAWINNRPMLQKKYDPKYLIGEELYDYKTDPLEKKSFIHEASHKEILERMRKDFIAYFNDIRAVKGRK
jgi:arylsulfatase A-like enzyme